jgi:PAS domain-containing protein
MLMMSEQAKVHCDYVRKYLDGQQGHGSIIGHRGRKVVAKHKDGSAVHVLLSIADPGDGTFVASFTDLTVQVRYDALVEAQKEMFRRWIEALVQPVVVADTKTMRITFTNEAATAVFGWPRMEMIGQPVEMFMSTVTTEVFKPPIHCLV